MAETIYKAEIKGYPVEIWLADAHSYYGYNGTRYYYADVYDGLHDYYFYRCNTSVDDMHNGIDAIINKLDEALISEEEILSPCESSKEYNRRVRFLTFVYGNEIGSCSENSSTNVYDFVNNHYVEIGKKDFVDHHIWLYMQLQKLYRPSIFPFSPECGGYKRTTKYLAYLSCLPYVDSSDSMYAEVMEYLAKYASNGSRELYNIGRIDAVLQLIELGLVKKPTMEKLLEMANDKEDASFAAVILDKLKDKKPKNMNAKFRL